MAVNAAVVTEVVDAIEQTGSVAEAANTLDSGDANTLSTLAAVNTLASFFNTAEMGKVHFGTLGLALSIGGLADASDDGEFNIEDASALSAAIGAALGRSPNPYAQGAAVYFSAYAFALPHLNDLGHYIGQNLPLPHEINDFFTGALNWVWPRDPLVLDLDGDGIETIGADGTVLFDHDGDGVKNGTGWIDSDDGILVLDRDGSGTIDSGQELFGNNTIKSDGTTASDGFDALSDLDSNHDGLVDSNDSEFSNLRVWRDLNADGISQAGELFTLNELNIESIGTGSTPTNINLGNENIASAQGSFTYVGGADGASGSAANLDLSENTFYREFTDEIAIPDELQSLPNLQGSGSVRDLQEASALNANLATLLTQYSQAVTKTEQLALIDQLLQGWADSSDYLQLVDRIDATELSDGLRTLGFRITKTQGEIDQEYQTDIDAGGDGLNIAQYYDYEGLRYQTRFKLMGDLRAAA